MDTQKKDLFIYIITDSGFNIFILKFFFQVSDLKPEVELATFLKEMIFKQFSLLQLEIHRNESSDKVHHLQLF